MQIETPIMCCALALTCALAAIAPAHAQQEPPSSNDDTAELAKKLQNPIAALISVPLKLDWDTGIGAADADRFLYVVQPVIPFSLNRDWNLISRTIAPYIDLQSPVPGGGDASGLGDILQSLFFSPKAPTADGWIWGIGPALSLRTASEAALGSGKWSAGPTAVVLRQHNGWTYGALANHLWSFAGDDRRSYVNATFVQPFVSFTTETFTTFSLNTESTYDWRAEQWTVPINVSVSQLVKIGGHPTSFQIGYRNYLERPAGGPDWGLRFTVTFLFPK
jgi:hypothetical protein